MLGKEIFTVSRPPKADPLFGVTWAYPSTYQVGMFGLGYQLVWRLLDRDPEIFVARAFTDSQEPLDACELVGFTLSWELDCINVLRQLARLGIPPTSAQRDGGTPLVFAGGPVLTANPEPFAELFDVILLGDAEATVPELLSAWKRIRTLKDRRAQLVELAQVEGIYVPSLYRYRLSEPGGPIESVEPTCPAAPARPQKKVFTPPPDYVAHSCIISPDSAWADVFLVEIARSCPQECRFCLASYLTRPFRAGRLETILEKVDLGLKYTAKIGLLGPSVTEHPQFDQLAEALMERPGTQISIASVRADTLNPTILTMLRTLGQKSVTIALESGSERLRAIMKKNLSEQEVRAAIDLIDQHGLDAVKLYGIVGLPGETQADLDETVRLLSSLKRDHRRLRFTLGVSSFVPKAQTPFQWAPRDRRSGEKLEYVRKHLCRLGIEVRPESHNWSDIQALLSRGDRRLTPLLLSVAAGRGNLGAWKQALRHPPDGCPGMDHYVWRPLPYDQTLPWSHLIEEPRADRLLKHSHQAGELARSM